MEKNKYITVFFDDEKPMLQAVKKLQEAETAIEDVLTPFPVHGLDKLLGMKQSRIPTVGFIFGAVGAILGFGFQAWVFTVDYPLIIGGKPFLSVPSFIPVTFEMTVLTSALGMVAVFILSSKLKPRKKFEPIDTRITDDRFVILIDSDKSDEGKLKEILSGVEVEGIKLIDNTEKNS